MTPTPTPTPHHYHICSACGEADLCGSNCKGAADFLCASCSILDNWLDELLGSKPPEKAQKTGLDHWLDRFRSLRN